MKPFVKWAGGKRQILQKIKEYIDDATENKSIEYRYIEPFLGGGAVFFDLAPKRAIINDLNSDLMNAYSIIKSDKYEKLISLLRQYKGLYLENKDEFYYDMRQKDREPDWPNNMSDVERAARMIFLNKTCYNGLYRVNNKGQFNTPIGRYMNPLICDEDTIREIHKYLSTNDIEIRNESYETILRQAKDGDIIYIDPPYDYQDDDGFTKYQMKGFTFEDFKKLKLECDNSVEKGAIIILSNNATDKVIALFNEDPNYKIISYFPEQFTSLRCINSNGAGRRTGREIIVLGMKKDIPFPQANDLNKVVELMTHEESVFEDPEQMKQILNVEAIRQVSYYLSALMYLGYIDGRKHYTESANKIRQDSMSVKKDVIDQLLNKPVFKHAYEALLTNSKVDNEDIVQELMNYDKLSESTAKRRASTVNAWVKWIKNNI